MISTTCTPLSAPGIPRSFSCMASGSSSIAIPFSCHPESRSLGTRDLHLAVHMQVPRRQGTQGLGMTPRGNTDVVFLAGFICIRGFKCLLGGEDGVGVDGH